MADQTVVGWRVWYSTGEPLSSAQNDWADIPADDVQVVMLYFGDGTRRIMNGSDYYWRLDTPDGPIYGDSVGDLAHSNYLRFGSPLDPSRYAGRIVVKLGKWTTDQLAHNLVAAAASSLWP